MTVALIWLGILGTIVVLVFLGLVIGPTATLLVLFIGAFLTADHWKRQWRQKLPPRTPN